MVQRFLLGLALAALLPNLADARMSASSTGALSTRPPASVTARYRLDRASGGCLLDVAERRGGRIRFQLFCDRGPPSYNTGFIEGTAPLAGGVAVFRGTQGGPCELRMTFRRGGVEMVETERRGGCGFGGNVYADGRYWRTRLRPRFDLSPAG